MKDHITVLISMRLDNTALADLEHVDPARKAQYLARANALRWALEQLGGREA